jgi:fibronectin-binding autotransporter adhesin
LEAKAQLTDAHTLVLISPGGTIETNHGFDSIFSGNVIGPGAFTKMGAGMLTFTGTNTYNGGTSINDGALTGANTYTGGTDINAGTVVVNSYSNLGTGPIRLRGGILRVQGISK